MQPHAFLVLTNGDQVSQPVITLMHSPFSVQPPKGSNSDRITNTKYKTDFKDLNLPLKTVRDKAKEANKPIPSPN